MKNRQLSLGIDTSNYKTSIAVVDNSGNILFNSQNFLYVKKGERGLRQSDAFFQHVQKLPSIIEEVLNIPGVREDIKVVSVSTRPRPIAGSYMPVFTAGQAFARTLSLSLKVPLYETSHQEGHVEAVRFFSKFNVEKRFVSFHFSGGTTEALLVDEDTKIFDIIGGTKDLAYGQVLDRIGVTLGYLFPCGNELDQLASINEEKSQILSKIKVQDCFVNLSGIETQTQRSIGRVPNDHLVNELFEKIAKSILDMTIQISEKYGIYKFLYAGGVSCSKYIRSYLENNIPKDIEIIFGDPELSSDNAVGVAILGGKDIWL